jgi:hypothetical protein
MAWYDTDPQQAQQVLAQLEQAAGRPLTPQEIEQAKAALPGDKLDPNALAGVQQYITQNIAGQAGQASQPAPTSGGSLGPQAGGGGIGGFYRPPAGEENVPVTGGQVWRPPMEPEVSSIGGGQGAQLAPTTPAPSPTPQASGPAPEPFNYQPMAPFQGPAPIERFSYDAYTKQFTPPTGLTEENDPGYQARLKLQTDALQRSAAARGTLLTGGTLRSLADLGQTFASNEYGNVYNRARDQYDTETANYDRNRQGAFQQWAANAGLSQAEKDQAWAEYQNQQQVPFNQQIQAGQLGLGYQQLNEQGRQADNSLGFNYANLGENSRQFGGNLGYNYWNAGNNQALSLAQLGQNNSQFNANLGYQYANLGENARQFNGSNALGYAGLNSNNNQFYSGLNANQGIDYARLMAGIYGSGAENFNNSIYGGASAQAGGQVASGTNWANLFTNAANNYASPYLARSLYGG